MMKNRLGIWAGTLGLWVGGMLGPSTVAGVIYETSREIVGTGDFDGDGRTDVVIVDKPSGKYRLGYQTTAGAWTWVNHRLSGIKGVTGLAIGKLLAPEREALALTGADAAAILVIDVSNPGLAGKPLPVPFNALGPSGIVALDIGGAGKTPLHDLCVGSIYNDPTPNKASYLRNTAGKFEIISEEDVPAQVARLNRAALRRGGREFAVGIGITDNGDAFGAVDLSGPQRKQTLAMTPVSKGSDYALGYFGGAPLRTVVTYKPGETSLQTRTVEEAGETFKLGEAKSFDLGKPLRTVVTVPEEKSDQLLVVSGKGEVAEVYEFDGANAPKLLQALTIRQGDLVFSAVGTETHLLLLTAPDYSKFATHCQVYSFDGAKHTAGLLSKLASMADNDDATVPEVHKRIVEVLNQEKVAGEKDMRAYTNTIPGTQVTYAMMPIPGGEFNMGSPAAEPGRQADEGPPHKVKISPFWMGKFEVTWNEYELFMYPDDEKKLRETHPSEEYVNKVSDAVTRPSKPYVEMSFGMGKDGYPAICMTQHAANKYCHWLSAKTGHFYRLPTEAEWEYACRAGTTTAYSFGDDPSKLAEYAWSEQNSDFKYAKVGKKKPNPWGLYDMHGNVWEWCLDQYEPDYQKALSQSVDPWNKATQPYPHSVRGGSYDDEAAKLRSAARRGSTRDWKMRDPQLPKSIWWHSDAQWVGLRLVRPLKVPSPEDLQKYWTSGVEKD